tara:strand:+ start:807 stop:1487 length:681 start_codon:yes stop_codon:yes gene_type:complete
MNNKKIIVALDSSNIDDCIKLVDLIKDHVFAFKIGYQFFFNFGLSGYNKINEKKVKIFLDLKLHDIPNTVKEGVKAISSLNPYFTTIHISGGDEMQKSVVKNKNNIKVLGVSILTSISNLESVKYYNETNIKNLVKKFVINAKENNLDGVVCSPHEISLINDLASDDFVIVTPGIRLENEESNDQKRFMTPKEAIDLGANYLVIGRPITKSSDPLKKIISINSSIE